jgi:hypothetical protein
MDGCEGGVLVRGKRIRDYIMSFLDVEKIYINRKRHFYLYA